MKLSNKAVEDFKRIYFNLYKIRLSNEEANELGTKLLKFYGFKYLPQIYDKR